MDYYNKCLYKNIDYKYHNTQPYLQELLNYFYFIYLYDYDCNNFYRYNCFTKFNLTGNYWEVDYLDYWLISRYERFRWIIEKLKKDNPEYNLAMYELYGFNEEYVRKELGYFKDICK